MSRVLRESLWETVDRLALTDLERAGWRVSKLPHGHYSALKGAREVLAANLHMLAKQIESIETQPGKANET